MSHDNAVGHDSALSYTPLDYGPPSSGSAFTTELPPEARMLIGNMGMDGTYGQQLMYTPEWPSPNNAYFDFNDLSQPMKTVDSHDGFVPDYAPDYFGIEPTPQPPTARPPTPFPQTGSGSTEESWDTFINDAAWTTQ